MHGTASVSLFLSLSPPWAPYTHMFAFMFLLVCPTLPGNMHTEVRADAHAPRVNVVHVNTSCTTPRTQAQHTYAHMCSCSSLPVAMCMSACFPVSWVLALVGGACALVAAGVAWACLQVAGPVARVSYGHDTSYGLLASMVGTASLTRKGCSHTCGTHDASLMRYGLCILSRYQENAVPYLWQMGHGQACESMFLPSRPCVPRVSFVAVVAVGMRPTYLLADTHACGHTRAPLSASRAHTLFCSDAAPDANSCPAAPDANSCPSQKADK